MNRNSSMLQDTLKSCTLHLERHQRLDKEFADVKAVQAEAKAAIDRVAADELSDAKIHKNLRSVVCFLSSLRGEMSDGSGRWLCIDSILAP